MAGLHERRSVHQRRGTPVMTRQIIEVAEHLLDCILGKLGDVRPALWQAGLDISLLWHHPKPRYLLIAADVERHALGHRPIGHDDVVAAAIVLPGTQPTVWPRPLAADKARAVLECLHPILDSAAAFVGHDRMELALAFSTAVGAPPTPSPPSLSSPHGRRQRRLWAEGRRLSRLFATELGHLDQAVADYGERVRRSDLEECIAGLSAHAELGFRLRLHAATESRDPHMNVRTIGRRSSLESLMSTVSALSAATIYALARYAPHLPRHNIRSTIADLAHLNAITTDTVHRTANNQWRDYDSYHRSLEDHSACRSPVPGSAVLHGAQRWIAESDPRCWTGVHALVSAAIMHMDFIRLQPFQRANRRLARTLFQAQLYESGWPVLPWHYAFERQHARYVFALEASFASRSHEPIVRFVLEACAEAIAKGNEMVSRLEPERKRLIKMLEADEAVYEGDGRWYAEALLSGIFLEGISSEQRGGRNAPTVLRRLYLAGELDRIHTPLGAVYSTPICRDLMK